LEFANLGKQLTSQIVASIRDFGWFVARRENAIRIVPCVEAQAPEVCFHLTLEEHVDSIMERGLLVGKDAVGSTSGWEDAATRIHLTFSEEESETWRKRNRLGGKHPGRHWAIIRIDSRGIKAPLIRDPWSDDGFILENTCIEPAYLTVIRRFLPSLDDEEE
jgi:hypothetical protein